MIAPVSVIFVGENSEQTTGSGCCGKLSGDLRLFGACDPFEQTQRRRRESAVLYRALRQFYPPCHDAPQVQITAVDPRNQPYLVPKLWHDVWHYRPSLAAALQTLTQSFSVPAVIVNGRVVSKRNRSLDPDALCHLVSCLLQNAGIHEPSSIA